ncbi:MAG: aminopeptidase P family N-terminal domain-containing protein, partial [Pseudomonadota bacterium]
MSESRAPFSLDEYARRLTLVRTEMAARGLDALFVEDPSNMAWLTGYDGWSFYVHQGVLLVGDQDPIWWGRAMDAKGALRTVWMSDDRIRGYSDDYVQATDRHAMQHLAELLAEFGVAEGRIGVELENYYFSAKAYLTLREAAPRAEWIDATALVNWKRLVKSEEEIAFMRKAARISEAMVDGVLE